MILLVRIQTKQSGEVWGPPLRWLKQLGVWLGRCDWHHTSLSAGFLSSPLCDLSMPLVWVFAQLRGLRVAEFLTWLATLRDTKLLGLLKDKPGIGSALFLPHLLVKAG